jgi:hypothetical protein
MMTQTQLFSPTWICYGGERRPILNRPFVNNKGELIEARSFNRGTVLISDYHVWVTLRDMPRPGRYRFYKVIAGENLIYVMEPVSILHHA